MELEEYRLMYDLEETHWWYRGLHDLVFATIQEIFKGDKKINILDAGSGTGFILKCLNKYGITFGIDFSEEAIRFCKLRKLKNIVRGAIELMPFHNNYFDMVISMDVLYHNNVKDDVSSLKEMYRILNENGILLLNLPAYKSLISTHDKAIHTRHRYCMYELVEKLEVSGFYIDKITYRNTILFPVACFKRLVERNFSKKKQKLHSDLKLLHEWINNILTYIIFLENRLITLGINFPFGLSLYCVCRKKAYINNIDA